MSEKVFESAFERGIERFANLLFCEGEKKAVAACLREHPDPTEGYMRLQDLANRAERARIWFSQHGAPCWCQPLPISYDEQENILCSSYMLRHMLIYYTRSLRRLGFDFLKHPLFYDYARGVMAHPDGPEYLLTDAECLAQFPPRMLPTGCLDEGVYWSPVLRLEPKGRMGKARSREELINS